MPRIRAIDLFCGTGGLSLGLKQAGIEVVAGIDVERRCEYPYEHNLEAKFVERSVADVTAEGLNELWGEGSPRLLAGCAPCQLFLANVVARTPLRTRTGGSLMILSPRARDSSGLRHDGERSEARQGLDV